MTFKDWADGCEFRLQRIAREIEAVGNSARQIRTNAVKSDQANTARKPANLPETLSTLLELVTAYKDNVTGAVRGSVLSSQLDGIETHLRTMLKGVSEYAASDTSEAPSRSRRKPPLLQKGARHFASLAGIFQLQDCFDQRVDHISTGTALALSSSAESQPLMLQIINAQVAGIATTTSDFTEKAAEASDSLKSMHEASIQDLVSGDSISKEVAEQFVDHILEPLRTVISTLGSGHLDNGSPSSPVDGKHESDPTCGSGQFEGESEDQMLVSLGQFEECFETICAQHPRIAGLGSNNSISKVSKTYDDLSLCIASLNESAEDLMAFTGDLVTPEQESCHLGPDAPELLESLASSFTMDSEREDHRSVLHRLGLASS